MKTNIEGKEHIITYIDYQDGLPHSVVTKFYVEQAEKGAYWRAANWFFFVEKNDKKDIRFYNSGSGGNPDKIDAPQWIDDYVGNFWITNGVILKGKVKNGKQLSMPLEFDTYSGKSINPFEFAEETTSYEYCARCGNFSTEYCKEHIYENDDGELRYMDDDSIID